MADTVIGAVTGSVLFFCIVASITTAVVIYLFLKWRRKKRSKLMDIFAMCVAGYNSIVLTASIKLLFVFPYRPRRDAAELMGITGKLDRDMKNNPYSQSHAN